MAQQWNRTTANDVFYRREPHLMRRYTALALDNISRRSPGIRGRVAVPNGPPLPRACPCSSFSSPSCTPLTICFVLTNMRYTITVQPLMVAFAGLAIDALLSRRTRTVIPARMAGTIAQLFGGSIGASWASSSLRPSSFNDS